MIIKEQVLPLTECVCGLVNNPYCTGCADREQQREADWKRVRRLVESLPDVRMALDSLTAEVVGHGVTVWGPVNRASVAINRVLAELGIELVASELTKVQP